MKIGNDKKNNSRHRRGIVSLFVLIICIIIIGFAVFYAYGLILMLYGDTPR